MLKTIRLLIGANLMRILAPRRRGKKQVISGSAKGMLAAYLFLGIFLTLAFFAMAFGIGIAARSVGTWFFCEVGAVMAFLMMVVGSVFYAVTALFDAKDNEMLLAMPIPTEAIILSRLFTLPILIAGSGLTVTLPFAVGGLVAGLLNIGTLLLYLVLSVFLVLFAAAVVCLLAYGISAIGARAKHKQIVYTVLMVIAFGLYLLLYTNFGTFVSLAIDSPDRVAEVMAKLWPFYMMGLGSAGQLGAIAVFVLISVLPAGVAFLLLRNSFIRIVTAPVSRSKKAVYQGTQGQAVRSARVALIFKEVKRFTGSAIYMFNAGIGLLFMVGLSVAALVKKASIAGVVARLFPEGQPGFAAAIFSAALLMISSMTLISAPSVSLEKNNLWILRIAPIRGRDVLTAKADAHVLICLPFLALTAVLLGITAGDALSGLLIFLVGLTGTAMIAQIGVVTNLLFPRLDVESDTQIIKQSGAVGFSMLAGFVMTAALIGAAVPVGLFFGWYAATASVAVLALIAAGILRILICRPLAVKFEKLPA